MNLGRLLKKVFGKPYASVGPDEAAALVAGGALLLDVREPAEWRAGHAPRARHVPLGQLAGRIGELPTDRPIVTACRSGARSRQAAALLARDHDQIYNLAGGMRAWVQAGLPLQAKGGRPGRLI